MEQIKKLSRPAIIAIIVSVLVVIVGLYFFSKSQREKRGGKGAGCNALQKFASAFGLYECDLQSDINYQKMLSDRAKLLQKPVSEGGAGLSTSLPTINWNDLADKIHETTKNSFGFDGEITFEWIGSSDEVFEIRGDGKQERLRYYLMHVRNELDWITLKQAYGKRQNCSYLFNCKKLNLAQTLSKEMSSEYKDLINNIYYSRGIPVTI